MFADVLEAVALAMALSYRSRAPPPARSPRVRIRWRTRRCSLGLGQARFQGRHQVGRPPLLLFHRRLGDDLFPLGLALDDLLHRLAIGVVIFFRLELGRKR